MKKTKNKKTKKHKKIEEKKRPVAMSYVCEKVLEHPRPITHTVRDAASCQNRIPFRSSLSVDERNKKEKAAVLDRRRHRRQWRYMSPL